MIPCLGCIEFGEGPIVIRAVEANDAFPYALDGTGEEASEKIM